jgi:3-oxoacyl-[acyl-carrier protein] reductase
MSDFYQQFAGSAPGKLLVKRLGLPNPVPLRRYRPGQRLVEGPVHVGSAEGGRLRKPIEALLDSARVEVASSASLERYAALVFDASGITDTSQLHALYEFFHPVIRRVRPSGRVIVLGTPPEEADGPKARAAQRALEGFTRSVGKELRGGASSQLVYVSPGAEDAMDSTLRFLLSAKSAYVSAQVIRIRPAAVENPREKEQPLQGRTALVTGASRGIGA